MITAGAILIVVGTLALGLWFLETIFDGGYPSSVNNPTRFERIITGSVGVVLFVSGFALVLYGAYR